MEHKTDADCRGLIDPATDCCRVCGVLHGDPCPDCGGRGFHRPDCAAEVQATYRLTSSAGRSPGIRSIDVQSASLTDLEIAVGGFLCETRTDVGRLQIQAGQVAKAIRSWSSPTETSAGMAATLTNALEVEKSLCALFSDLILATKVLTYLADAGLTPPDVELLEKSLEEGRDEGSRLTLQIIAAAVGADVGGQRLVRLLRWLEHNAGRFGYRIDAACPDGLIRLLPIEFPADEEPDVADGSSGGREAALEGEGSAHG